MGDFQSQNFCAEVVCLLNTCARFSVSYESSSWHNLAACTRSVWRALHTVAQQKKLKLPSTRVGAKFDHRGPTTVNWLPSFGRVWSKNCRTHSQYVICHLCVVVHCACVSSTFLIYIDVVINVK